MMPRNTAGTAIRAADYNRSDGFSPGQTIVTLVPGLDLRTSRAVPQMNMSAAFAKRAPIVVIDAKTGERQLIWAELDSQATGPRRRSSSTRAPTGARAGATSWRCATSRMADGRLIGAQRAFRRYRDGLARAAARAGLRGASSAGCERSGIRARAPLPGLGLHGRQPARTSRAAAVDARPGVRRAGRQRPRRLRAPRVARPPSRSRGTRTSAPCGRVDGTFTALLPRPSRLPASGARFAARPPRAAASAPGKRPAGALRLPGPRTGRPQPARPLIFGHGLFGGAEAVCRSRRSHRWPTSWPAAPTSRACPQRGRPQRALDLRGPVALPHAGGPQPAGPPQLPVPRPAAGAPAGLLVARRVRREDRPPPAVLRGRQPGRHPRRRRHGSGARPRALGADGARHPLQPARSRAPRRSSRSPRCSSRPTPTRSTRRS